MDRNSKFYEAEVRAKELPEEATLYAAGPSTWPKARHIFKGKIIRKERNSMFTRMNRFNRLCTKTILSSPQSLIIIVSDGKILV